VRLAAVVFRNATGSTDYARLAQALERSVAVNSPHTPIDIVRVAPDDSFAAERPDPADSGLVGNARKVVAWNEIVQAAPDGEALLLLDCDTLVLGDLEIEPAAAITYTARPSWARLPFNAGVILVRGGPPARRFFVDWTAENLRLLHDRSRHRPLREKFGGLNQAALGVLRARGGYDLAQLPCVTWNCEHTSWPQFGPETKILHLMGRMRAAALGTREPEDDIRPMVELWRRFAS
jgi:hypothetical protein